MKGREQNAGEESVPKKSAWDSYRRWRKFTWLCFPVWFCLVTFDTTRPIFGIIFVFCVFCGFRIQWFECPRCEECFFIYPKFPRFYWPSAKKCMNCGLPKWDDPPPKPAKVEIYPIPKGDSPRPDPVTTERLRLAKFLTLVLRDDPKAIGLRLDANGWADVGDLLKRANCNGIKLTCENLDDVLTISENHHFERDQPGDRIRWNKG